MCELKCFQGIREFAISPLLVHTLSWPQYARRKLELDIEYSSDQTLHPAGHVSWSDLRTHKTLDTGMSGVLAGGLLRGWKCTQILVWTIPCCLMPRTC